MGQQADRVKEREREESNIKEGSKKPMIQYWLMKTEPGEYSYEDLERDGWTHWDGVRNHQAQNNMKQMAVGDEVLIYHSVGPKEIVGIAQVSKRSYPDPTAKPGEKWIVVDVKPLKKLATPVKLAQIKATPDLLEIPLVKQSRLSVMPLEKPIFDQLVQMGGSH